MKKSKFEILYSHILPGLDEFLLIISVSKSYSANTFVNVILKIINELIYNFIMSTSGGS